MVHKLKAFYIAKKLPIQKVKEALAFREVYSTKETAVYRLDGIFLYVYSFGSIVFVNCPPAKEALVLNSLKNAGIKTKTDPITEEYAVIEDPKVKKFTITSSNVVIKKANPSLLKVIARVIAQSVALESYESYFSIIEEKFKTLNQSIEKSGKLRLSGKDLMRMIAHNNTVLDEIVSGIGVLEKPEAAWESHLIDSFHTRLSDEFELEERFENLNSKLNFVQDNYKVFLEGFRSKYEAKLEWAIIILIFVEIVLFVYELFTVGIL